MIIPAFRNLRIRTKLICLIFFLVLLPLSFVAFLSMLQFGSALRSASEDDLEHLVKGIYSICKIQLDTIREKKSSDLRVAWYVINRQGRGKYSLSDKEVQIHAMNRSTGEAITVQSPLLKIGETIVFRDYRIVDEVRKLVGSICAIFQIIPGDRFLKVSSNVVGKDGKRDIGTFIPPDRPESRALLEGRDYRGSTYVDNDWYTETYEPIFGTDGKVLGALYIGVKEQVTSSLRNEIKGIRVGETGYVYIIDSTGTLRLHPAREGSNIIDAEDTSGYRYIQSMIDDALKLPEGETGTIRYPWANPELGDTVSRQKIHKFIYFKPRDWIIAAGTYEEEIYQSLYKTRRFIFFVVLGSIVLTFLLTLTLSKILTDPIQNLTAVTTRMVEGDLSLRAEVFGADEIGVLGTSFNRMIGKIQDYTINLKQMVDERTGELRESKERYRELSRFLNSILDSATEYAIMALDYYGMIIEFNKGAEKIFGWNKEEVVNKRNINTTITPEDQQRSIQKKISKKTRTEGACDLEMFRLRKDGTTFPAHTIVTAIRDSSGDVSGFVEIIRDITERKSLERELKGTKDFLQNIMESSVDGILTTNLKGKITYCNRAMEDMVKCRREEVIGTHISQFYTRGIEEARDVMGLLVNRERAENYEMEVRRTDGALLSIQTSLFLLRDEEERVIGTAGIFKDITEQKRLKAELESARVRLVEASKMRALGELVSGVAHELNNPLMASQTILFVILKNLPQDSPERERLELIRKCNDRIARIVDHLREFSRESKPSLEELDINLPLENALMITGQQLLNHNITTTKNLSPELPVVLGDVNQLEQVFLNIISNARDALDESKGTKELTFSSRVVEEEGKSWVVASIRDTGVGIPEENLDKVFEPFFSTKPVGRGTGLGLSLCFGIIQAHEGRLEINSRLGIGTEVDIFLPEKKP